METIRALGLVIYAWVKDATYHESPRLYVGGIVTFNLKPNPIRNLKPPALRLYAGGSCTFGLQCSCAYRLRMTRLKVMLPLA